VSADYRAAGRLLEQAARGEDDFAGWLAAALAWAAAGLGSSGALTAGRPGSWEAALVDQLVKGTVGYGDEQLPHRTAEDDGQDVTGVAPTGSATLSPADVLTVLGALRDGARWNDYPPGDPAAAARYRSLAKSIAEDR
jgi:hypothetical protein